MKPRLVISGVNLFEGGPLSIYYDCLDNFIEAGLTEKYRVTAFVHKIELFEKYNKKIELIDLPKSRRNYLYRLYYEYVYFMKYSKKNIISVWISLHDITPNVKAEKIYTYCHNPSPFLSVQFKNLQFGIKNVLFPAFYRFIYRINIYKNSNIIVQEDWMRQEFKKMFHLDNVIVARPDIKIEMIQLDDVISGDGDYKFVYSSFPRVYKNIEIICEAVKYIEEHYTNIKIHVFLTLDGRENKYSEHLASKYGCLKYVEWVGILHRKEVFSLYKKADCLIFPSKMETWGLPITEFEQTGKPMIVADLPYAHETVGNYKKVAFFDPDNAVELAEIMVSLANGKCDCLKEHRIALPAMPFARNWKELFEIII